VSRAQERETVGGRNDPYDERRDKQRQCRLSGTLVAETAQPGAADTERLTHGRVPADIVYGPRKISATR